MSKHPQRQSGLILLVVLSMLTLFSLLSITYVVFSSQSRTSSMGMARRDHHRMQQDRLLDYSLQQVLRGSKTGSRSAIGPHSLLADVYGHNRSLPANNPLYQARFTTGSDKAEFFPVSAPRFLRIPLLGTGSGGVAIPPSEGDVLTGRVLTFMAGPLRNISFRIVRSFGIDSTLPADFQYSVIIDLMEASKTKSNSLSDWTSLTAPVLCQNASAFSGYMIRINDRETNGFGIGIGPDGMSVEQYPSATPLLPVSFLPRHQALTTTTGDTDESYDVADYNDMWLAHKRSGATAAEDILPSFHRAALINYIVNSEADLNDTTLFTESDFIAMLDLIERACPRPLGISVIGLETTVPNFYNSVNRDFAGSNLGAFPLQTPTLDINLRGKWTNWTVPAGSGPSPKDSFLNFVRFLTKGPWDVDNDGDGIGDSVWVDLDMPLMTSPEGKLLKMLTAYYIVDLDSKLDLNAVGNLHQTTSVTYNPTTTNAFTTAGVGLPQGFGTGPADSSLRHLFATDMDYLNFLEARYGGTNGTPGEGSSTAINNLVDDLRSRLDGGGNVYNPALPISLVDPKNPQNTGTRERRQTVQHNQLPGLPIGIRGAEALGFDRLGNPLLTRGTSTTIADQGTDDPYEFRLLEPAHSDLPFTIAEWERIYRKYDWDVSMLPRRLKSYGVLETNVNAVTPRSSHMRNVPLAARVSAGTTTPAASLYDLIVRIGQNRPTPLPLTTIPMFKELFPFEFGRGMAMDINRPFGNGIDDDMDGQIDEPEELLKNRIDDNSNGTVDELAEQSITHRQGSLYTSNQVAQVISLPGEYPTFGEGYTTGNMDLLYEGFASSAPTTTALYHHGQQSRQLLARHLYCLAMLLLPESLQMQNLPTPPLTGPERARVIAQWAVNVVDFRDADHAMTRFPYDPDPFITRGSETTFWVPNKTDSYVDNGEVVWGMEQPELLLTETLATHDLRVKDTTDDTTGKSTTSAAPKDDDYDQYRIPEGSLFLEFFCPRTTGTATDSTIPGTGSGLYTTGATNRELNLNAISPTDGVTNYPVWRVALTLPHMTATPQGPTLTYQLPLPPSATPPTNSDESGLRFDTTNGVAAPTIDRILWFTNTGNITNVQAAAVGLPTSLVAADVPAHVFGNVDAAGTLSIQGGQYLVVGPRQTTYFGSKQAAGSSNTNLPNNHRIVLENSPVTSGSIPISSPSWANVYTGDNVKVGKRATMRESVSMVAVTSAPWGGGATVGINVSEPHPTATGYYDAPSQKVNSSDATGDTTNGAPGFKNLPKDSYHDYGSTPLPGLNELYDQPFDAKAGTPIATYFQPPPYDGTGVATPKTKLDWCTAYLQRLADPERPWHAALNPYMTVDWMRIDLTVFSGEESIPHAPSPATTNFGSRQKNGQVNAGRGTTFLSYNDDPPAVTTGAGATNYFTHELLIDNATNVISTLTQVQRPTPATSNFSTLGYLNSPYMLLNELPGATATVPGIYIGSPSTAPLSLTWFNRPFASPYELMLVPLSSPGQLMQEFNPPALSTAVSTTNHYADPPVQNAFPHLLNFFQPRSSTLTTGYSPAAIFELITTPSPWSDADSIIPPTDFTPLNTREFSAIGVNFIPPFNRVSKMVERGRLNINTVSEEAAWQGVEWNYMNTVGRSIIGSTNYWTNLTNSRRGYALPASPGNITSGNGKLDPGYPTEFAGVFKSQFAVGMVPTLRPPLSLDAGFPTAASPAPVSTAVTLFRKGITSNSPLFAIRSDVGGSNAAQAFNEYLPITRLANLTTNRSNVFAIYMTIGYFEFDPSTGITQEYGWDNGKTRRHRGFYVVDRSIPVAFEPGVDNNTENCVLTRRIIE